MALRVLFPFVGDTVGGSHVSTAELIDVLPKEVVEPVVVLHRDGPLAGFLDRKGIAFEIRPELPVLQNGAILKQLKEMAGSISEPWKMLRKMRIDVVHTNEMRMHISWLLAARLSGVPQIWHQRNLWRYRRQHWFALRAQSVLTISDFCRDSFPAPLRSKARIVWDPVSVSNGWDRVRAREAVFRELGLHSNARLITFVGNYIERKRPAKVVEVTALLHEAGHRDVHALIIGEAREPMATKLRRLIKSMNWFHIATWLGRGFQLNRGYWQATF